MKQVRIAFKATFALCLVAATAWLSSCALRQRGPVAGGLLAGEPCGPPCWQGLVPGVSREDEVRELLTTSDYVGSYHVRPGMHAGVTTMEWRPTGVGSETTGPNWFDVQDGVLVLMTMNTDHAVTLAELVEAHGTPDMFSAGFKMSGRIYIVVSLFYRELGMILNLHLPGDDANLTPQTKVTRVWYFQRSPLAEAMATQAGKRGEPLQGLELEWLEHWHDWGGYGTVQPDHGYP